VPQSLQDTGHDPLITQERSMKILVAVDGSSYTKQMLAYLAAHEEWLGPAHDETVLMAVPKIPQRAPAVLAKDLVTEYYRDEAEKVFKPIRTFFEKQGLTKSTFTHVRGHAADEIARAADAGKFDLLVMGTHGHSALGSLVMGSVTTRVLAQCKVPVLLVR
jgi:nucleotide-binding universal stress UspA family protein